MEIIPAILTNEAGEVREWVKKIKEAGKFARIQVDFVDGKYNNNTTIKPDEVDISEAMELGWDAHLMVVEGNIAEYVEKAEKAGFDRIVAQVESIAHPENLTGLALDIHSPVEAIEAYAANLEVVLVMGVEPGFGGQKFGAGVMEKVGQLVELRKARQLKFKIGVDGGVEEDLLAKLAEAGADEVVVGAKRVWGWKTG